ncbi:MAG: YfiR family protein [Pseudomonadota bacterium]
METSNITTLSATTTKRCTRLAKYCYRLFALIALIGVLDMGNGIAKTEAEDSLEYAVKGAFLFKFSAYIEWPLSAFANDAAPFVIGILGEDPFGAKLDAIVQDQKVQGRPVVIKRYKQLDQARGAHILYISAAETEYSEQIFASLRGSNILTVSEESFETGSIINFVVQENKVRFVIDLKAADIAALKVSSKLLALAKVVDTDKQPIKK